MNLSVLPWPTALFVAGFVAFWVNGGLCLRMAAERSGAAALGFFAAGNVIGFCGTIFLTLSLRGQNPNVIYALCFGLGFCALQLAAYGLFRVPLSPAQWLGVALIATGVVCVQFRP
jgi:multidrug transporter EmrE-like cation transporter